MKIVLAGGGSGGHIYPLVALAQALRNRNQEVSLTLIGQPRSREEMEANRAKIPFQDIHHQDNRRRNLWHRTSALFWAGFGVVQSIRCLRVLRPDCVVGAGGYVSLPVVAGARFSRLPYVLLEQNMVPGKVTRAYCRGARAVFLTFPGSEHLLASTRNIHVTGNPIRMDLIPSRREARQRLGIPSEAILLVVVGGSQGALRLNEATLLALPSLFSSFSLLYVLWVAGKAHIERFRAAEAFSHRLRMVDYETEMPLWIAGADLFLGRAGSGTISEVLAAGVPSLLVPYPYAADAHQAANARFLEEGGAAQVLPEERLGELTAHLHFLLSRRETLDRMSRSARTLAKPEAANTIADWILAEFMR
jgi:UDP-N-acetylglucosamine--N-acetylmuramyl-(pentapeptide) pyrophosphoryl-undecaprenol N-acetylglucosamine transferase